MHFWARELGGQVGHGPEMSCGGTGPWQAAGGRFVGVRLPTLTTLTRKPMLGTESLE